MCSRLLVCMVCLLPVMAQADEWQYRFTPFVWTTHINTQVGRAPSGQALPESDINVDELLDLLDLGWMHMFEARRGQWSLLNEVIYMQLGTKNAANGPLDFLSVATSAEFEQAIVDFMVGYTPGQGRTTFFGGLRYIYLDADLGIRASGPAGSLLDGHRQRDEGWIDPVIGIRHSIPFNQQWQATVQADAGGGLDSEFSSITTATLDYRISETMFVRGGYRYARIDRDDSELLFDQTSDGFLLALQLDF